MSEVVRDYYSKNEMILDEIKPFISEAVETTGKSKRDDLCYRVKRKLTEILRRNRTLPDSDVLNANADDLWEVYIRYSALISELNKLVIYTPDKLEFCAYARMSVNAYNALISDGSEEVRQVMCDVDSDLLNAALSGAEAGISKEGTARFRAKGKGFGHSVVETDGMDNAMQLTGNDLTAKAIEQELRRAIAPPKE